MEQPGISGARPGHLIRRFCIEDAAATRLVFYDAVHIGAADHYTPEQRAGWAPSPDASAQWGPWLAGHITLVSTLGEQITGFMMLERNGYLNMAFVRPDYRRTGLADALYRAILAEARALNLPRLTVLASHMAARFFARQGWQPAPELAETLGESALNHAMKFDLDATGPKAPG